MVKTIIRSDKAPAPIGPYNIAVKFENLIFTSGQIPIDKDTGEIVGRTTAEQTQKVLENLKGVLESAGTNLNNVVKTTVFLKNMSDFSQMNEVYAQYFEEDNAPARSAVEVACLPKNVLVEIEAIAGTV